MAETRRINTAPKSAVLYIYDPSTTEPLVEPAPNSLVVVVPSDATDILDTVEQFFSDAAKTLRLRASVSTDD